MPDTWVRSGRPPKYLHLSVTGACEGSSLIWAVLFSERSVTAAKPRHERLGVRGEGLFPDAMLGIE